jgi:hypothetical protein
VHHAQLFGGVRAKIEDEGEKLQGVLGALKLRVGRGVGGSVEGSLDPQAAATGEQPE